MCVCACFLFIPSLTRAIWLSILQPIKIASFKLALASSSFSLLLLSLCCIPSGARSYFMSWEWCVLVFVEWLLRPFLCILFILSLPLPLSLSLFVWIIVYLSIVLSIFFFFSRWFFSSLFSVGRPMLLCRLFFHLCSSIYYNFVTQFHSTDMHTLVAEVFALVSHDKKRNSPKHWFLQMENFCSIDDSSFALLLAHFNFAINYLHSSSFFCFVQCIYIYIFLALFIIRYTHTYVYFIRLNQCYSIQMCQTNNKNKKKTEKQKTK